MAANILGEVPYVQGDTLPSIAVTVSDEDATGQLTPVDITGYTFELAVGLPGGVLTKAGTVIDPASGELTFAWAPGDLNDVGSFDARVTMTTPSGSLSWQAFSIVVVERVAAE